MVEDVRLAVEGRCEVSFYGRPGGVVSNPEEIARVLSSTYHRMESARGRASMAVPAVDLKRSVPVEIQGFRRRFSRANRPTLVTLLRCKESKN